MRDLKNVIFFDDLLQESYNALVRQAKEEGKYALGYTCYFMPEVLLDLPGCFSVRLRAPRCTSPDMATYYMSSRVCHYARSLLDRTPRASSSARSRAATTSSTRSSARRPAPALAGFRSILPSCLTSFRTKNSSLPSRMFRSKRTRTASNTLLPRCRSTFSTSCTNISASTRPTKLCAPRSRRTTRSATSSRRSANSGSSISPRSPARSSTSSISSRWSVQSI